MKKSLSIIMCLFMLISTLTFTQLSAGAEQDDTKFNIASSDDKTVEITGYRGTETDLVIPSKINGLSVTSIGYRAFLNNETLTSITIPEGVSVIGSSAFGGCASLKQVVIPDSVTLIDSGAFSNCTSLTNAVISNNITKISVYLFGGCEKLTSITIPKSVTRIEERAFDKCSALEKVELSDNITDFNNNAFNECNVKQLTITDGSKKITPNMVICKSSLEEINIPKSVDEIELNAFDDCNALKKINIQSASAWCKMNCLSNPLNDNTELYLNQEKLTDIIIPNDITSIRDGLFYNCSSIKSVIIPDSVTSIGENAFYNCYNIEKIFIPISVDKIGAGALKKTSNLTELYYQGSTRKWNDRVYLTSDEDLKYVTIHYNANYCDAYKHNLITANKKGATYISDGNTGDKVCTICKKVIEKGKTIAKLKLSAPTVKLSAAKRKLIVKYKKVKNAVGFQIRYKIKGNWIVKTFNTQKSVTKTIKKLKKGKHKVQVRAFVNQDNKKAYSNWTKTKTIKVR